jgi:hypothetical protein
MSKISIKLLERLLSLLGISLLAWMLICIFTTTAVAQDSFDWDTEWYLTKEDICEDANFPNIPVEDNIFNDINQEYLVEVLFNEFNDVEPTLLDPMVLQYYFIDRYYDTCKKSSQEWHDWIHEINTN